MNIASVRSTDPLGYRHQRVQRVRRLLAQSAARQREGCFVIEGLKVLRAALDAGITPEAVYIDAGARSSTGRADALGDALEQCWRAGVRIFELGPGVLARVAETATPQPVLAVVPSVDVTWSVFEEAAPSLVVVAVDVRDPGNAGTLLRSAEAAGADAVICCDGCVDVYNPKTVRASAGALFSLPVLRGGPVTEVLDRLSRLGLRRLGTAAEGGIAYSKADLVRPVALIMGNEAHGLSPVVRAELDELVSIPMRGRSESLNVGVAAAVLCFEAVRQRGERQGPGRERNDDRVRS